MKEFKCCVCGKDCYGYGNNPWPLSEFEGDLCCDECNAKVVIARLTGYTPEKEYPTVE